MIKSKKGAIELSMSTIVVVVIAIVLLSLGIMFVRNIMGKISTTSTTAFDEADRAIQDLMGGDEAFYIAGLSHSGKVGEKLNINSGIQNFEGKDIRFKIEVSAADGESDEDWINVVSSRTVKAGDKGGFPIIVSIPKNARSGSTNMYEISVYDEDGNLYGSEVVAINVK